MKILPAFLFTLVLSLGFGGCCLPPGPHTVQPPAIILNPPQDKKDGGGPNTLYVKLTTKCLPVDVIQKAVFLLNGVSTPVNKLVNLKPGKQYVLKFPKIPGFVTPPDVTLPATTGEGNKVVATYNRASLLSATPGRVVESYQNLGAVNSAYLDAVWTPPFTGAAAKWWLNAASPRSLHTPPALRNFQVGVGTPTMYFGPLAGYNPPLNTVTHVYRNYLTIETVTYVP